MPTIDKMRDSKEKEEKSLDKEDNSTNPEDKEDNYINPEDKEDNSINPEDKEDNSTNPEDKEDNSTNPEDKEDNSTNPEDSSKHDKPSPSPNIMVPKSNEGGDEGPLRSPTSPDTYFPPVVQLELVDVRTMEEDEDELFIKRAKLFRYISSEEGPEWKERGIGDVKILQHKINKSQIRLLMRQEKTLTVRANHYIDPLINLEKHCDSDRAFVWFVTTDIADGPPQPQTFAIRFKHPEDAESFSDMFTSCQKQVSEERERSKISYISEESSLTEESPKITTGEDTTDEDIEVTKLAETLDKKVEITDTSGDVLLS